MCFPVSLAAMIGQKETRSASLPFEPQNDPNPWRNKKWPYNNPERINVATN